MINEPVRTKLMDILAELEERAHQTGQPAYRNLFKGLVIRIEEREVGYQVAIAREWPSLPSEIEERTVLRDLQPLFAGGWHRFQKQRGRDGRVYNVSKLDYHR